MKKTQTVPFYPLGTATALRLKSMISLTEPLGLSDRASSRMVRLAANLPEGEWVGWQMKVQQDSLVDMGVLGSDSLKETDLAWVVEEMAAVEKLTPEAQAEALPEACLSWEVYEGALRVVVNKAPNRIGFGFKAEPEDRQQPADKPASPGRWPLQFSAQFGDLVTALRMEGGILRYAVGSASQKEQEAAALHLQNTWTPCNVESLAYIGTPVKARLLFLLPQRPSARLLAVFSESLTGLELRPLGSLRDAAARKTWETPLWDALTLPDYAARMLALEPRLSGEVIPGVLVHTPPAKVHPARHAPCEARQQLVIGRARNVAGLESDIALGDSDLKRHWQIIGQTGTGKSSLLLNILYNAMQNGTGFTFFDPHGTTINLLLEMVPKQHLDRVQVIRLGDVDNPVPINLWNTDNPARAERSISDLTELMMEIFDPGQIGIVGPRWERMFYLLAYTSIAVLGKRASFESIALLARNKHLIRKAADAIRRDYPSIADSLRLEFVDNNSSNYEETISWFAAKLQRLTSVEQLRNTLGAGHNALDFAHLLDTDTITLVDLGMPIIGAAAARVVGTILLMQLWSAALTRAKRDITHIIAMDEAHLFQTSPLPQMLAEGRKFGLAMILAHQHINQLSLDVRDALSANSANFSAFRLSIKDAALSADRFDIGNAARELSRMDAFCALTTLSVDGQQTPAFTLKVPKPKLLPNGAAFRKVIEERSVRTLVEPYRHIRPITDAEVSQMIAWAAVVDERDALRDQSTALLDKWLAARKQSPRAPRDPGLVLLDKQDDEYDDRMHPANDADDSAEAADDDELPF